MENRKLLDAPLAIASSGQLIANATHLGAEGLSHKEALEMALETGRPIFIDVVMTTGETLESLQKFDEAAAEIVATTLESLGQRARG